MFLNIFLSILLSVYVIIMMKLLELVVCCGSSLSSSGTEGGRLWVVPETRRRRVGRYRGRLRGARRKWRPSLSSISEDNDLVAERMNSIGVWRRILKRRLSSILQRDRPPLDYHNHRKRRRQQLSVMVPVFAPTPFMF